MGTRMAVTREKRSEHCSKRSMDQTAQDAEAGLSLNAQTKAREAKLLSQSG